MTATIPMPILKVRNISSSATLPACTKVAERVLGRNWEGIAYRRRPLKMFLETVPSGATETRQALAMLSDR